MPRSRGGLEYAKCDRQLVGGPARQKKAKEKGKEGYICLIKSFVGKFEGMLESQVTLP